MKAILAALVVLLAGCSLSAPYDTTVIPDLGHQTPKDVFRWISANIEYAYDEDVHDERDEWQLPHETYLLGTGDCEDFTILAMYLLSRIGVTAMFESGWDGETGHAWLSIAGQHYQPNGMPDNRLPERYSRVRRTLDLDTVTRRATYRAI